MKVLRKFVTEDELDALVVFEVGAHFEPGRQETGYQKATVPQHLFKDLRQRSLEALGCPIDTTHDCYVLRYPVGSYIPPHTDDAPFGQQHHRLNALVVSGQGGDLYVRSHLVSLRAGDAYRFRPDIEYHEVSTVTEGFRLIWAVGVLI